MYNWLVEWRNANAGIAPSPRLCVDAIDLAFWFNCFSLALNVQRRQRIEATRMTIVVRF